MTYRYRKEKQADTLITSPISNQEKLKSKRTLLGKASLFLNSPLLNSDIVPSNKAILKNWTNICRENPYPLLKANKYQLIENKPFMFSDHLC